MFTHILRRLGSTSVVCGVLLAAASAALAQVSPLPPVIANKALDAKASTDALSPSPESLLPGVNAPQANLPKLSLIHKVREASERLEMIVNTSRILTMDQKIPQVQVNNPEILDVTCLSPTEIQISAKNAGWTQVNLWGEDQRIYTIDVLVIGDAQALAFLLQSQFPSSTLRVVPVATSVLISGFVEKPEQISQIVTIAEQFYPKVINAMTVGGVQQILLHVKVMEVSRTKLRKLGVDFANFSGGNTVVSGVSGLISSAGAGAITTTGQETFAVAAIDGASRFFGVLEALRQDDLAKVLAEPALVAVSGRPAQFNSGGEIPVPVPQSLGTISIEFKKYGTQLDFVPIVLGNGNIRLEVRPRISELDRSRSVTVAGTTVPGLRVREVETGVEMRAGQTLAIAGLVYEKIEAQNRGLPWISEVPYLGVAFGKKSEESNTIELVIMVTPELIEPMEPCQVPPCGPGMLTESPSDWELYMKGHLEVPRCCPTGQGGGGCPASQGGPAPDGMIGPVEEINSPQGGAMGAARGTAAGVRIADRRASAAGPHNRQTPNDTQRRSNPSTGTAKTQEPGLIGPIGYDAVN